MHRDLPLTAPAPAGLSAPEAVRVQAPGRLHLGFLDPAGSLGRRFGSLGLVIDGYSTTLTLRRAPADRASAADPAGEAELPRALRHLEALRAATGRTDPLHLHIARALPAHAGFGSGTQLGLAVGRAFAALHDLPLPTAEIARLTGRGLRSGVGIAGFDQGGLLLDGGPGADGAPAPVLARLVLPEAWRVLVVLDRRADGLHGDAERAALARLAPLPRASAAEICHEVLMRVLAGAASAEFEPFARGLSRVQEVLGGHFAPVQRAGAFASPAVGRLIGWIGRYTLAGTGQSSWGPTGFAVLPSEAVASEVVEAARRAGQLDADLALRVVTARAQGATLTFDPAA